MIDSLKEQIQKLENQIEDYKEDLKRLSDDNQKIDEMLKEKESEITTLLVDNRKAIEDYNNLSKKYAYEKGEIHKQYEDLLNTTNQKYNSEIEKYKDIAAKEIENSKSSIETSKALAGVIMSQQSSIAALAEGIYNQEHIEFFALKTYRGWKYICVNGDKYTDFENINSVGITWNKEENRLNVNIK